MVLFRDNIIAATLFVVVLALWALPALSDPPPPNIDWKKFQDLLNEDPEIAVGEEMC